MNNRDLAEKFVRAIASYDDAEALDLKLGGDGDNGEYLVDLIDLVLDSGRFTLTLGTCADGTVSV